MGMIRRVFLLVANINDGTIFSLLPFSALFMGICLYDIEHVNIHNLFQFSFSAKVKFCIDFQTDFSYVSSAKTALYVVTSSVWPYLFCFCANYVVDKINTLGNKVYSSNWYDYPHEWQKYIPVIVARSQQTVEFTGFNFIPCSLVTFGKVSVVGSEGNCIYSALFYDIYFHLI